MQTKQGLHDPRTLVPSEIVRTTADIRWNLSISADKFAKGSLIAADADGFELRIIADHTGQHIYKQCKDGSATWYGLARTYAARLRMSSHKVNHATFRRDQNIFSSLSPEQLAELVRRIRERAI